MSAHYRISYPIKPISPVQLVRIAYHAPVRFRSAPIFCSYVRVTHPLADKLHPARSQPSSPDVHIANIRANMRSVAIAHDSQAHLLTRRVTFARPHRLALSSNSP